MPDGATRQFAHLVALGLGSNLGDRDANLRAALEALAPGVLVERVSSVYDTAPMLVTEQPRFHNIACLARTDLSPHDLLHAVKGIEVALGRRAGVRYGPRLIDVDILFYDQLVVDADDLVIPHPRLAERRFALAPLAEIAPLLRHPILDVTIQFLLERAPVGDARKLGVLPDHPA
ncbi:MAG TPA: 2-amino-4-hydroxy-6-hydroxymethyldihydropteridine diphosphokinase [Ktedonobacterales bacterium]|nr:2-amino-4-hydroxy-6-hydroxymethyldihydropteridine diphosphokinase [Ktedonobacterales bacterium]